MKKAIAIGIAILYNLFITLIAGDLAISNSGYAGYAAPDSVSVNPLTLIDYFHFFGDLISFDVDIPDVLVLIFVYLPNIVLFLIILAFIINRD